jgi:hypothetical protein
MKMSWQAIAALTGIAGLALSVVTLVVVMNGGSLERAVALEHRITAVEARACAR